MSVPVTDPVGGLRRSILLASSGAASIGLCALSLFATFSQPWIPILVIVAALGCVAVFVSLRIRLFSAGFGLAFLVSLMAVVAGVALTVQPGSIGTITGFVFLGIAVSVAAIERPRVALPFGALAVALGIVAIAIRSSIPFVAGGVLLAVTALSLFVVLRFRMILQEARDEAVAESMVDPLTGLVNRRGLEIGVESLASLADRTGQLLGCLVLDLDHFKRVNDRFGHEVGDETLRDFAAVLRTQARTGDLVARLGGEEFAVFTMVPSEVELATIAERLRARVEKTDAVAPITVSIGGAAVSGGPGFELRAVMSGCDRALYEAKAAGRNQVKMARLSESEAR